VNRIGAKLKLDWKEMQKNSHAWTGFTYHCMKMVPCLRNSIFHDH